MDTGHEEKRRDYITNCKYNGQWTWRQRDVMT